MNSLIKETNDNLRAIVDTLKGNLETYRSAIDNIQIQMDKKVEEAKSYKIQVDSAKQLIKDLENDNKSLELSLKELNEKYAKLNLVSVVEAGNTEIKAMINNNVVEINTQKEKIAELTGKARMIKDLLISLKEDKVLKEEKLNDITIIYNYYNDTINKIVEYSFNHSENLDNYRESFSTSEFKIDQDKDIENTLLFDEIANIDEKNILKDEMSFISEQIEQNLDDDKYKSIDIDSLESTKLFDSIVEDVNKELEIYEREEDEDESSSDLKVDIAKDEEVIDINTEFKEFNDKIDFDSFQFEEKENDDVSDIEFVNKTNVLEDDYLKEEADNLNSKIESLLNDIDASIEKEEVIEENKEDNVLKENIEYTAMTQEKNPVDLLNTKIDTAFKETFEQSINEEIKSDSTLLDIFGNPITNDEISTQVQNAKKIEELFVANGIDFNKFKDDEQNYLRDIYDEDKFNNIFETLKRNKISVENLYKSFNIFGEITPNELEGLISKLIMNGQSVETIGYVLEKLPKVKNYKLDEAIMSYGDYVKDIDLTELIMKAKELKEVGGNL